MFHWFLDILVGILVLLTWSLVIINLFKCSTTDPGIIPGIKSDKVDKTKHYCK